MAPGHRAPPPVFNAIRSGIATGCKKPYLSHSAPVIGRISGLLRARREQQIERGLSAHGLFDSLSGKKIEGWRMGFDLRDKWVWDFWFARDGGDYHLFFLQADRSLGDPDLRHWHVNVGHAVSQDLRHWERLPDALAPSPREPGDHGPEPGDTLTTWTGSVIRNNGAWYMFYTGTRRSEKGLLQRVCLATSDDLVHWTKHDRPVLDVDPRWYDTLNLDHWHDQSWRDPWVFRDSDRELYHMLLTCRVNDGAPDGRGAVGYASSTDLVHWQAGEPLLAPGWYGEMEVPQIACIGERYYLFCSVSVKYHSRAHLAEGAAPQTGLKYFPGDGPLGPFHTEGAGFLDGDPQGSLYAGRVIEGPGGQWYFMAFRNCDHEGRFVGGICDPIPVLQHPDGHLTLSSATEDDTVRASPDQVPVS